MIADRVSQHAPRCLVVTFGAQLEDVRVIRAEAEATGLIPVEGGKQIAAMNNKTHDFDEQSALQALEQLRDQIQRARSRREQKLAEFETFLRSNRAASQAERSAALDELER